MAVGWNNRSMSQSNIDIAGRGIDSSIEEQRGEIDLAKALADYAKCVRDQLDEYALTLDPEWRQAFWERIMQHSREQKEKGS